MTTLADMLEREEQSLPGCFPSLRKAEKLFALSDFSGEDSHATHQVFTVLLFDPASLLEWDHIWQPIRQRLLKDRRRMAFKRLEDRQRARALSRFLEAAEHINGLLFSLAVNRQIKSIFDDLSLSEAALDLPALKAWKPKSLHKLLLSIHVVSLLAAGLAAEGQDLDWYTDEDEIAPNVPRLYDACEFFARISSHYLSHNMRHFRFGTAKSDDGTLRLEDLLSLPDLAAGAISELIGTYCRAKIKILPSLMLPIPGSVSDKSRHITSWLAHSGGGLKKLVYTFEPGEGGEGLSVRRIHLYAE
jgi:hypothetical protein